jgi:hypothetical protein
MKNVKEEIYSIKPSKLIIVFIGYIALVISNIVIWIQYILGDELSLVFSILYTIIGLGVTTPIILKVIQRKFYLIVNEKGFLNRTGLNKSDFISWENVKNIHLQNDFIRIDLSNHDEYISKTSWLNKIVSKINKSSISISSWYLNENSNILFEKMNEYVYKFLYQNVDFQRAEAIKLIGVYSSPFLGGYISVIELDVECDDIERFVENTYVLRSVNKENNQVPLSMKIIENSDNRQTIIFYIALFEEKNALITPFGNFEIISVDKLPERLKGIIDYHPSDLHLELYKNSKPLTYNEILNQGTAFVELSSKVCNNKEIPDFWSEDSIYFNLEYFEFLLFFIPKELELKIYDSFTFLEKDSKFIQNMELYIENSINIKTYNEFIKLFKLDLTEYPIIYKRYINDFMEYPGVIVNTLNIIIEFIKTNNYEFTYIGI